MVTPLETAVRPLLIGHKKYVAEIPKHIKNLVLTSKNRIN